MAFKKKQSDVLLVNPPSKKGDGGRGEFFTPPMGLAYIASHLKKNHITVDIIDCNPDDLFLDYFIPKKSDKRKFDEKFSPYLEPLIVGIGPCTTPYLTNTLAIAKYARTRFKNCTILLGGPHGSLSPPNMAIRLLKEFNFIDAVVVNEGEQTVLELIQRLRKGIPISNVKGLVSKGPNGFFYCERPLMDGKALDSLPFPDRDFTQKYLRKYRLALRRNFLQILSNKRLLSKYGKFPPFAVLFSSRGCPHHCNFCCSLSKRRLRSAESVVREINSCLKEYDIHCFVFYDDLFTTASKREIERIRRICQQLLKEKLEVFWQVELRADVICGLGKDVLSLMNSSGCGVVNIGIEKATNIALQRLNKKLTVDQILKAIELLRKSGDFIINGTFILGGPNETKNDILDIIYFSKTLGIDYAAYYPLEIHPGTKLFSKAREEGLIDDIFTPYVASFDNYPLFVNENLSKDNLLELQCKAYKEFYLNARKIENLASKIPISIVYEQYEHFFQHAFIKGIR